MLGTTISPLDAATTAPNGLAAHNRVRMSCDSTALDLAGHVIATTCEQRYTGRTSTRCPAAMPFWHISIAARTGLVPVEESEPPAFSYGAGIDDAASSGFRELSLRCHQIYRSCGSNVKPTWGVLAEECRELFKQWENGPNPKTY